MKMKNLEKIEEQIRKNCTITVKAQIEEYLSPRDCLDAEGAAFVEREIEKGNEWAWCSVKVTVSYEGLSQDDYLGGCSHANKEEFMESGYMKDMVGYCIAQIRDKVINIIKPFVIAEAVGVPQPNYPDFGPVKNVSDDLDSGQIEYFSKAKGEA